MARAGLPSIIATVMLLLFASPASAHYIYNAAHVYVTGDSICTWARAEISHNTTNEYGGYVKSSVALDHALQTPLGTYSCKSERDALPGYLATAYDYYKWNGSAWYVCRYTNFYYNSTRTHKYEIYTRWSSPPCGRGYYGNMTYSYVKTGGAWYGGDIWSGDHYIG